MARLLWPSWRSMTISGTPRVRARRRGRGGAGGREASPYTRLDGGPAYVGSRGGTRPVPATRETVDDPLTARRAKVGIRDRSRATVAQASLERTMMTVTAA